FTPEAVAAVGRISQGIPRVVNLLCDRALEAAYASKLRTVDAPLVSEAAVALGLASDAESVAPAESVWPKLGPVADAAEHAEATAAAPRARRYGVIAASLAVAAVMAWFGVREIGRRTGGASVPGAQMQPPQPAAPPGAPPNAAAPAGEAATPPPPAPPAGAPAPAAATEPAPASPVAPAPRTPAAAGGSGVPSAPAGDRFEIVVASFRPAPRANDVANAIAALPEPVRPRSTRGGQQGPARP